MIVHVLLSGLLAAASGGALPVAEAQAPPAEGPDSTTDESRSPVTQPSTPGRESE